jgi:hypothetical protein
MNNIDKNLFQNLTEQNLFRESTKTNFFQKNAVSHMIQNNELSNIFFSQNNIDALQQGIRYLVWKNSNGKYVIGNQSETQLQIIMRSIYLQYSKNLSYNIISQIKDLNQKVLDYIIPQIIIEIDQYNYYIKDTNNQPIPLERSINTSSAGTKFLFTREL